MNTETPKMKEDEKIKTRVSERRDENKKGVNATSPFVGSKLIQHEKEGLRPCRDPVIWGRGSCTTSSGS
jgi:hypothetical protein